MVKIRTENKIRKEIVIAENDIAVLSKMYEETGIERHKKHITYHTGFRDALLWVLGDDSK